MMPIIIHRLNLDSVGSVSQSQNIPEIQCSDNVIEVFQIEFYRICKIYTICRKLILVDLKMKITQISLLQIL